MRCLNYSGLLMPLLTARAEFVHQILPQALLTSYTNFMVIESQDSKNLHNIINIPSSSSNTVLNDPDIHRLNQEATVNTIFEMPSKKQYI